MKNRKLDRIDYIADMFGVKLRWYQKVILLINIPFAQKKKRISETIIIWVLHSLDLEYHQEKDLYYSLIYGLR